MSSVDLRRIGGALALFWAGGSGPSRAQIQSALMVAGYAGPDEGNKQEFVQSAVTKSEDGVARLVIEELLSLLRESGYFEAASEDPTVDRLRRSAASGGHSLTEDGFITWADSPAPLPVAASSAPPPASPVPVSATDAGHASLQAAPVSRREVTSPDTDLLVACLRRLGTGGARPLIHRRRSRGGVTVEDEYDIQDLVESMLRCLYNDVRHEEPTPSSAGSSSRIDLHLREGSTAVETKVTAPGRAEKELKTELLVDINDYRGHPRVRTFIAVIYDLANTLANPAGFEHDLSRQDGTLEVRVVVVPWVGPRSADPG